MVKRNNRWLLVLLVLVIAGFFRFYRIASIPPGLYPDEAMNGNNALEAIATGNYKVFYPENNGREGLFINIQAQSVKIFGNEPWALRIVSGIFGVLTVLGTYFLASKLFNWQIGLFSSFFLATSFWHTLFSRIGFRAISAPFFMVWGLYFLWRGLSSSKLWNFGVSGILFGLGFYTYISFRAMPLVVILALLSYWATIKKDFSHEKYIHTRNQIIKGLALLLILFIFIFLPLGYYFYANPGDFLGRTTQVSIFTSDDAVKTLTTNTIRTLGMFNFIGDYNWRHNFSGAPELIWPVGILFIFGFFRSWIKLFKNWKKQGHPSTTQILLLSWFFVGLLPVILSVEGIPHALRAIMVAPVVFIFAGEGLWWLYDMLKDWYVKRDFHEINIYKRKYSEGTFVATLAMVIFMAACMIIEYDRYFYQWALNSNVPPNYSQNYVDLGNLLNILPQSIKKYVVVNANGTLVNDIPMPAQTIMFITDTWTLQKQKAKNLYYLTEERFDQKKYDEDSFVIPLEPE